MDEPDFDSDGAPPTGRIDVHLLSDIVLNGRANHVILRLTLILLL